MNPQKQKTIKMRNRRKCKEIYRMSCLIGYGTSEELRRDPMQRSADTSSSSHEPPLEPRAYVEPGSSKHSALTHFPKDTKLL